MTIGELLSSVDDIYQNAIQKPFKLLWLNQIESDIAELMNQYGRNIEYQAITADATNETTLLAPEKFTDIYVQWLLAKIYQAREESVKFNDCMNAYNNLYYELKTYLSRTSTHKHVKFNNYTI